MNAVNLNDLGSALARRPVPAEVIAAAMPVLRLIAIAGVREHFARQESPDGVKWRPLKHERPNGGSRILEDTGKLKASIGARYDKGELFLTASTPSANIHQFGGRIRPKRARMLAIPLTREAKRVGSPRQNRFPRPLFVLAGKDGGSPVLAESVGKGAILAHYVLKREVLIPPRPYLGFSRATQEKIERVLQDRIATWIAQTFGQETNATPLSDGTYATR